MKKSYQIILLFMIKLNMKYKVIENHRTEYPNPILLSQGEKVILGEEDENIVLSWV